jgi:hypothetical protein
MDRMDAALGGAVGFSRPSASHRFQTVEPMCVLHLSRLSAGLLEKGFIHVGRRMAMSEDADQEARLKPAQ